MSCGLPCPETAAAVSLPRVEVFFGLQLQVLFEGGRHRVGLHSGLHGNSTANTHYHIYLQTILLKDGIQLAEVVIYVPLGCGVDGYNV
jgi:hypothetical protein